MKSHITWILIANSSYVEILELRGKEIEVIERKDHPEGRQKIHELISDKPGRTFAIASTEGHNVGEEEERVRKHDHEIFMHEFMEICLQAKNENRFDKLSIIAPPHFLGEIREIFHHYPLLSSCIHQEIAKDLPSYLPIKEKLELIQRYLPL